MSDTQRGSQVLALVAQTPESELERSTSPRQSAEQVIDRAATQAALAAGAFALPVGPLGWLTIAPEMLTVWRLQRQLVADVAALYGRAGEVGPSQMMWCLFRHTAAQALRDLTVRVGERLVLQPAAQGVLQRVAASVGVALGKRAAGHLASRWLPVIGAAGVGAYAYYDTRQVGRAAIALFEEATVIDA